MSSLGPPLPTRLSRRTYLATLGMGCLAALSGCNGFFGGDWFSEGTATEKISFSEGIVTEEINSAGEDDGGTTGGWGRPIQLTPADDSVGGFGGSVALADDGTTALVSARNHETSDGPEPGPAYIVERTDSGWRQQATLVPDNGHNGDPREMNFGGAGESTALSADGTTALVGADEAEESNHPEAGAAYVFRRTDESWDQQAKLVPDDVSEKDFFGHSVALSDDGTVALIGAWGSGGVAYVFERTDGAWSREARISPNAGLFAKSVALGGDAATAIIGAPLGDTGDAGAAFVYQRDGGTWRQQPTLKADDGDDFDSFGDSVTLAGDTALVGAPGDEDPNGEYAGSAYVFRRDGGSWRQEAKLAAAEEKIGDRFGGATALTGDGTTALLGVDEDEDSGREQAGSAYVFERTNGSWSQEVELAPEDSESDDEFGRSVALAADTAVVGSQLEAYVY